MLMVWLLAPGQGVPPQVVEQVRVRVMDPLCVAHDALHGLQADWGMRHKSKSYT